MERETYTIDATKRVLGRLATEVATLLRGKNKATYQPNKDEGAFVVIKNIGQLGVTGKKMEKKIYFRHSEYLGGETKLTMAQLKAKKPKEILRAAVWGMMPKNKLRAQQIKRLKIEQ